MKERSAALSSGHSVMTQSLFGLAQVLPLFFSFCCCDGDILSVVLRLFQVAQPSAPVDPLAPSFVSPPTPLSSVVANCSVQFPVQALGLHSHDVVSISLLDGPAGVQVCGS